MKKEIYRDGSVKWLPPCQPHYDHVLHREDAPAVISEAGDALWDMHGQARRKRLGEGPVKLGHNGRMSW